MAVAVDVGQASESGGEDWEAIRHRALAAGAVEAVVVDARAEMAEDFCVPALAANARYEGKYPLVSALSRPVIVKHLVAEARRHGADAVAHGCTGKGNDQVRFEVGTRALAPDLEIIAPARVWGLTREDCVEYAANWDIPLSVTKEKLYSIDENLWGRAIECGVIEDPWDAAARGRLHDDPSHGHRADRARGRIRGRASRSRWTEAAGARASHRRAVNRVVGSYGYGRLDMVENRRVGIKSRETYECPAALALLLAHADLEDLTLERDLAPREGPTRAHGGRSWSTTGSGSPRSSRPSTPSSSSPSATSPARSACALEPGSCWVVGRRSPVSLYDYGLATYDAADTFRHRTPRASSACGAWAWPPGRPSRTGRARDPVGGPPRGGTADVVMDYSVSLPYDRRLALDDLAGSRAHVRGLGRGGAPRAPTRSPPSLAALDQVEEELAAGVFDFAPDDEDIHTAVERRVTEIAGDVGAKLHTGRSRNDQIATDLRLYARRELTALAREVIDLQSVLLARADEADEAYLPGYTHLQRAQPVLLAHHLLAHGWALARDVDRLVATVIRLDVSPLGCRGPGRLVPAPRPRRRRRGPRVRRPLRELAGRRLGPRLRGRGPLRPRPARRPPVPDR